MLIKHGIPNMINKLRHVISALLVFTLSSGYAAETPQLPTLAPVLKNAMPAIVNVAVQGINPGTVPPPDEDEGAQDKPQVAPQPPKKFQSIGSGVIIDPENGVISTNDHVIRNATLVTVT